MQIVDEKDWKLFRAKIGGWQERYIGKLNAEYVSLLSSKKEASEIFWGLENRINKDKRSIAISSKVISSL